MSITPERHLFLQGGNAAGDSSLVLSTDAKPRLKWTPDLHDRFVQAVNQLGGADSGCIIPFKESSSVVEKAQDTLGRQNLGTVGLEAGKVQLSELATKVSTTKYIDSAFPGMEEVPSSCPQHIQASQPIDCSAESCMASYEIFQQGQENQERWNRDLKENRNFMSPIVQATDRAYEIEFRGSDLSTRVGIQGGKWNSNSRDVEEKLKDGDINADLLYLRTDSVKQENERLRQGFQISNSSPRLDLNIHDDSDATSNCKQFDLNGFSWS